MIVDTSALVAIVKVEAGSEALLDAVAWEAGLVPSPVLVEFERVTAMSDNQPSPEAGAILETLLARQLRVEPFNEADARSAAAANEAWGSGNGRGGPLNMLDLMVYAVAKRTGRPILCTGRDFAATDAAIHPASRID